MSKARRYVVSLSVDVAISEPFITNDMPDKQLLERIAKHKIAHSGARSYGVKMTWRPKEES